MRVCVCVCARVYLGALLVQLELEQAVHGLGAVQLLDELLDSSGASTGELQLVAALLVRHEEPERRA